MTAMSTSNNSSTILDRMVRAVEKVRERLLRATSTLDAAGVRYAVIGGNAVAAWVATVDEAAVRNTRDVDILLRREDLEKATIAMEAAGFRHPHALGITMFLDGPEGKPRDAVHVIFAGEKVRDEYVLPAANIEETEWLGQFHAISLEALVRMKLTSYRDQDRTHLRDMIEIELIDGTWCHRYPPELSARLQEIIDHPEG
jgi:hypothetical protein